jgi:Zn-dependent protease
MSGKQVELFTFSGLRVRAETRWFPVAALVIVALALRYFPASYPNLSASAYWGMSAAGAVALFGSILLHELSHALVARRYGVPSKGITLAMLGGRAEVERELSTPGGDALMAVAGPCANLLTAALSAVLVKLGRGDWPVAVVGVLAFTATVNLLLTGVNALPVYPLDGGRVVRALLWRGTGAMGRATRIAAHFGEAFAVLLAIAGVAVMLRGHHVIGAVGVLAGVYLLRHASSTRREAARD